MKEKNRKKRQSLSTLQLQNIPSFEPFMPREIELRSNTSVFAKNLRASNFGDLMATRKSLNESCEISMVSKSNVISRERQKSSKEIKKRSGSPDLIRDSSNTILQKIQEGGISVCWEEDQDYGVQEREQKRKSEKEDENLFSVFSQALQKSFGSTADLSYASQQQFVWSSPEQVVNFNSFQVIPEYICFDWRTTIMIRNIPNKYNINDLADEIDSEHSMTYNFLYLPCDLKNNCNVGYGFINFTHTQHLLSFYYKFNNYIWRKYRSQKICSLTYARLQGLQQLIEHFENSKIFNQKDKKYKPIIRMQEVSRVVNQQQQRI